MNDFEQSGEQLQEIFNLDAQLTKSESGAQQVEADGEAKLLETKLPPLLEDIADFAQVYNAPASGRFRANLERSLLLIKPEAVQHQLKILARLKKEGFFVIKERHVRLSPEQASELFAENYGQGWFPLQVALLSRAPLLAVCVAKLDCISELAKLVGPSDVKVARRMFPNCLRAKFANPKDHLRDAIHVPEDAEKAEFEIHFFFPNMLLEPLWKDERAYDYFAEHIRSELLCALAEVCKVKPIDPVLWLARYLLVNDNAKPRQQERIATLKT